MASQPVAVVNHAVVELVGLGKDLTFLVVGSDSQELPPGSSFSSRPHLWSAAFGGTHPHVKCDIQEGHIYFVGKLRSLPNDLRWGIRSWRPYR